MNLGALRNLDALGLLMLTLTMSGAANIGGITDTGNSSFWDWRERHTTIDWMTTNRYGTGNLYRGGSPHELGLLIWNEFEENVKAELGVSSKQEFYNWLKENTTRATEYFKRRGWYIWDPIAIGKPRVAVYYAAAAYNESFSRTGGDRYDPDNIGILGCMQNGWTFRECYWFLHNGSLFDERLTRLAINYAHTRSSCYYGVIIKKVKEFRDITSFHVLDMRLDPVIYGEDPIILKMYEPKWVCLKNGHIVLQTYGFIQEYWLTHDPVTGRELPREEKISYQRVRGGRPLFLIIPREVADKYITFPFPQHSPLEHMQNFITLSFTYGYGSPTSEHKKFAEEYSSLMQDLYDYYERKGYDPTILAKWTGIPIDHEMLEMDWLIKEGFPSIVEPVINYYAHNDVAYNHTGIEKSRAYAKLLYAWMIKYGAWLNEYDHKHLVDEYLATFYSQEDLEKIPKPGWQPKWNERTFINETALYRFIEFQPEQVVTQTIETITTTMENTETATTTIENTETITTTNTTIINTTTTITEERMTTEAYVYWNTITNTIYTTSTRELDIIYANYPMANPVMKEPSENQINWGMVGLMIAMMVTVNGVGMIEKWRGKTGVQIDLQNCREVTIMTSEKKIIANGGHKRIRRNKKRRMSRMSRGVERGYKKRHISYIC